MRYLIVSDIHSNWEGLQAVLAHAGGRYDRVVCCGDLVGYGADPNAVIEWARANVAAIVRGNHDKACAGLDNLLRLNPVARAAALWTTNALSAANLDYLKNLPKGPLAVDDFQIMHGAPIDEDEYVLATIDVDLVRDGIRKPLTFFGHTHLQGGFFTSRKGTRKISQTPAGDDEQTVELWRDWLCLANPGSVGQPRDRDPRAAYMLYSPGEPELIYRRVNYDVAAAEQKILKAGLPESLAHRLARGV